MKKEGLILLALVLVFGFVVLGCGSTSEIPIPPPPPEPKVLFQLSENAGFQALTDGETTQATIFDATGGFLTNAGSPGFKIVTVDTKKALEVTIGSSLNWGAGFDFVGSAFKFAAGDTIEIKGKAGADLGGAADIRLESNIGAASTPIADTVTALTINTDFEIKAALTEEEVTRIAGRDPANIRVRPTESKPDADSLIFTITEIIYIGTR